MNKTTLLNRTERSQDRVLVQRMLTGEESAYREFVDRYKDRLFTCMLAQTGNRCEAEEIVQESFVKVFVNLAGFQHDSQLYTWVYRIAWNTWASRARRQHDEISLEASGVDILSLSPESLHPHVPLERLERVALLRRALSAIENRHRRILLLREFEERSYQEIAEIMGIPLGTVRSRLSRARDRLKAEVVNIDAGQGTKRAGEPPQQPGPALAV